MKDWSTSTVPEIKAELKKRRLRVGGKKAELVLRLTTNIENERFEYFPKLPVEIRLNIWKMALPGRRIIKVDSNYLGNSVSFLTPRLVGIADLLLTCKESSEVALNHVRPMQGQAAQASQSAARGHLYHEDVFYFYDYECLRAFSHGNSFGGMVKEIKAIAVPFEGFFFYDIEDLDHSLELFARFQDLEAVICIEDTRPVKQNNRRNKFDFLYYLGVIFDDEEPARNQPPLWMPSYDDVESNKDGVITELGYLKGLFKGAGKHDKAMEPLEKVRLCYAKVV